MFKKKVTLLVALTFLISSCTNSWDSVKRGLSGQKKKTTDEFLVKKKDPLVLPPDFDSLPTPADREEAAKEMSSFEKTLTEASEVEISSSSTGGSTEDSILKQIKKK